MAASAYDDEVFAAVGVDGPPENPYFLTKRRAFRNDLYIPKDVVADLLKLPKEIKIGDENGGEWTSKVRVWNDGGTFLSSQGWIAFCRQNNVEVGDTCICEFIPPTEEDDMFLKVSPIPAANKDYKNNLEEVIARRNKKVSIKRNRVPKKRAATAYDDEVEVFAAVGIDSPPENRYFVTRRRATRFDLYIPKDVIEDLKLPDIMEIRNKKGNLAWTSKINVWSDGRTWLSTDGWNLFCEQNDVEIGDMCICELIPATEKDDMYMKISTVPAASRAGSS